MIEYLLKREIEKSPAFKRDVVFTRQTFPMMVLEKYEIDLSQEINAARKELEKLLIQNADNSHTWGYFPQYCDNPSYYSSCIRLGKRLTENLIRGLSEPEKSMSLAFIRLASDRPNSSYGGLHIDVDSGVAHQRDKTIAENLDIIRLIVNLGEHPRIIEHIPFTKEELRDFGYKISDDKYEVLTLKEGFPKKRIEIPPRKDNAIYALKFWSSQVPHAGITDECGHFMAAFGCYANMSKHTL